MTPCNLVYHVSVKPPSGFILSSKTPCNMQVTELTSYFPKSPSKKVTIHPVTGHGYPDWYYSSFILGATCEGWSTSRPGRFTPGERPGTHCIVSWVGPRTRLNGCGKYPCNRDSIPGPSTLYRVAIPTEPPRRLRGRHRHT